jgi:hypothetical protein
MPKKLEQLDHKYNEKLAKIRQANVQRHAGYENALKLRQNIQRFQRNATYDMELQRLRGATAQGHIAPHAHKRVADLKNILGK